MSYKDESERAVNENIDKVRKKKKEPVAVKLGRAHEEMTIAVLGIQSQYGLPAYLTDFLLTSILADIRSCANKELIHFEYETEQEEK